MKYDEKGMQNILNDSRYQDIGNLPSNFFPYDFKKLYIRPFTVNELRLVSKAATLKEMSHLIRAIDLVTTEDASNFTIGDFYYILMWLRIHSMPKTPYVIEWHCHEGVVTHKTEGSIIPNDANFKLPEDEENWEVKDCNTHNSEVIHMTDVEIICIEDDFPGLPNDGPLEFDFPRARHLQDIQEALKDPELNLLVGPAQWIKDGDTIEDKINILATQSDLQVFDDAAAINDTVIHGIAETAMLTCRTCLKKTPHTLVLDALSFFR